MRKTREGAFFMLKIAIYGKGGIGKSTVTSHLA
ncbi:MAG: nitrogen fixation protein NifH, partial [Sarcina sp.]|nr:nitrogen fixation protein NifH [Sarcina sp.]